MSAMIDLSSADLARVANQEVDMLQISDELIWQKSSGVPSSLLVAYSFDAGSGSVVADASGNGHNLPLPSTGPPSWSVSGHTNGGISNNGTGGSGTPCGIDRTDWETWLPIGAAISTMCWAKFNSDSNAILWSLGLNSGFSGNFDLYYLSGFPFKVYMTVLDTTYAAGGNWTPDFVWHHWAATCDGVTLILYLDGAVFGEITVPDFPEFFGDSNMMVGLSYPTFNSIGMDGAIDDFRVYAKALTPAEIAVCMNTPVGTNADPLT
jgi:hypothetical protein